MLLNNTPADKVYLNPFAFKKTKHEEATGSIVMKNWCIAKICMTIINLGVNQYSQID